MEPVNKKKKLEAQQVFKVEYSLKYDWVRASRKGETFAFCMLCNSDFGIYKSGMFDIKRHAEGKKHMKMKELKKSQPSLFKKKATPEESNEEAEKKKEEAEKKEELKRKITTAEIKMCELLIKHNLPFSMMSSFTQVVGTLFEDSVIAKGFACSRTKSTSIVKELAASHQSLLIDRMKTGAFTVSTDGSTDQDGAKTFPIVVRTVDELHRVQSELLALPELHGSATGEAIFHLIDGIFKSHGVKWENCIAIGCDNASVMTGKHKGLRHYVEQQHGGIFTAGCVLHLAHIAAEKGAGILPVSASELLTDIYYYLNKSSLRQDNLKKVQEFHGVETRKMLKHVCTRWLSIGRCLDRLLVNWDVLKKFFKEESASKTKKSEYTASRLTRTTATLRSRSCRLYLLFLRYATTLFEGFLTTNQSDAPKIHCLRDSMQALLRKILSQFVRPSAFGGNKLPSDVDYKSTCNIKPKHELLIGADSSDYIKETGMEQHLTGFYCNVIKYYQTVASYLKSNLPFEDKLLKTIRVADLNCLKEDGMISHLQVLLARYPCLKPSDTQTDLLQLYALLQTHEISVPAGSSMDVEWGRVAQLELDGQDMKPLATAMLRLLTIPHSSAHCERVFSCVRKNKTDFRSSLSGDTLESIMILKCKPSGDITEQHLEVAQGAAAKHSK